ncbi:MAG: protoporphyrinogen oxidase [Terracoccus sp.]
MSVRVAVIGGGVAGLSAAWELVRSGEDLSVTLFEGSDRVGGKMRLAEVGGAVIDVGAESVLARRPEAVELFAELGLGARVTHPSGVGAAILSRGRRWPMPRGTVMGVPSDPESVRGLLTDDEVDRLAAERVGPPVAGDVAVGAFIAERLGPAVTDRLVEPLLAGVYAGHSRELSLEMSVPVLHRAAVEGRSVSDVARETAAAAQTAGGSPRPVFATLRGGLGALPTLLAAELLTRGVDLRLGETVRALQAPPVGGVGRPTWTLVSGPTNDERAESFDAVVLATPAAPGARLLAAVAPDAARLLSGVDYASVAIVSLVVAGRPDALEGSSGFLVPPTESLVIKASTFSSSKWTWLREAHPDLTFLRASVGRHREEASLQRPDDELVDLALGDVRGVLGVLPEVVGAHVQRWGGGLPQYAVGHRARVEAVRDGLPSSVVVAGAAYDGVGVPACIGSGRAAARTLVTRLRTTGQPLRG